jgi:peptidoglycan/LPS O-acetylase OafA/YrhL
MSAFRSDVEALRGYAAFSVLAAHTFLLTPSLVDYAPIVRFVFNENAAVLLFFIISGYVLGLQLDALRGRHAERYLQFIVRRVFRIWPPLVASIAVCYALGGGTLLDSIEGALFVLSPIHLPVWTIIIEWYAAFLVPVIYLVARRGGIIANIAFAFVLWRLFRSHDDDWHNWTKYLIFFHAGMLIDAMRPYVVRIPRPIYIAVVTLAFCAYGSGSVLAGVYEWRTWEWFAMQGIAALVLLACVVHRNAFGEILRSAPMRYIGGVSFSVYLIHFQLVVLFGLAAIPITLALAYPMHRFVEIPANNLGRAAASFFMRFMGAQFLRAQRNPSVTTT